LSERDDIADGVKLLIWGTVIVFAVTGVILAWTQVFGPKFKDQQREQFEHSRTHTDAVVQDLSDKCLQLAQSKDDVERKALQVYIIQIVDGEDMANLQMADWVHTCVNDAISAQGE
jgi:hypothetical protein